MFPVRLSVGRIARLGSAALRRHLRDVIGEHEALRRAQAGTRSRQRLPRAQRRHPADARCRAARGRDQRARQRDPRRAVRSICTGATGCSSCAATPNANARACCCRAHWPAARSREREFESLDAGGERLRIYWRCIARRDADGSPAGWLCSGADVTEHALRAEDAHLAQDRLTRVARLATMGEMAAGVAHEINQPLTAITTYARACRALSRACRNRISPKLREAVREIDAEGLRAGEIIRRLRQMVRTDAPRGARRRGRQRAASRNSIRC